ncbi:MAG: hypothetical protein JJT94_11700, partial [Bernardetiaceae bacterium]|nr:hypothetical protein [Bernardetiaceae bacterium]
RDLQSVQGAEEYRFLFNGKERETALSLHLYDFHARQQDPQLGRFWGVDALAEERNWLSSYNFVQNNPLLRVDPDGKLDGNYFIVNSDNQLTYLGSDGIDDGKVFFIHSYAQDDNGFAFADASKWSRDMNYVGQYNDIINVIGAVYGESATNNDSNEMQGIAHAIINNNNLSPDETLSQTATRISNATRDGNARYNAITGASIEDIFASEGMQAAFDATLQAMLGFSQDNTNGATHWDGADIETQYNERTRRFGQRWGTMRVNHTGGYNIASVPMNNAPIIRYWKNADGTDGRERGRFSYRFETTAAINRTVFSRKTPEFIRADGNRGN